MLAAIFLVLVFALMTVPESGMNTAVHAVCPPCGACLMGKVSPLCSGGVGGTGGSSCGTVGYFLVSGFDGSTDNYSDYGVQTVQTIDAQTICGTSNSTGSGVGNYVTVYFPGACFDVETDKTVLDAVSVGYYEGVSGNGTWGASTPHFYWDDFMTDAQGICQYTFYDLSQASSIIPQIGAKVTFQLVADAIGESYWTVGIAFGGETITMRGIPTASASGFTTAVTSESHNDVNKMTAWFSSLANLAWLPSSGATEWRAWTSSYTSTQPSNGNPYEIDQCSVTSFSVQTGQLGGC